MAYVKCWYVDPVIDDDTGPELLCHPELRFIEKSFKRVEWDGATLTLGTRNYKEVNANGCMLYYDRDEDILTACEYGKVWIKYLQIDGQILINKDIEEWL